MKSIHSRLLLFLPLLLVFVTGCIEVQKRYQVSYSKTTGWNIREWSNDSTYADRTLTAGGLMLKAGGIGTILIQDTARWNASVSIPADNFQGTAYTDNRICLLNKRTQSQLCINVANCEGVIVWLKAGALMPTISGSYGETCVKL